jgi:predicted proteasome-type protease
MSVKNRIKNEVRSIAVDPKIVAKNTMTNAGLDTDDMYSDLLAYNATGDRVVSVFEDTVHSGNFYIVCMSKRNCGVLQFQDNYIEVLENEDGVTAMTYADGWIS